MLGLTAIVAALVSMIVFAMLRFMAAARDTRRRSRDGGEMAVLAIDHILLDPRCAVRAFSAHRLPGTDHRALYAQIQLPR